MCGGRGTRFGMNRGMNWGMSGGVAVSAAACDTVEDDTSGTTSGNPSIGNTVTTDYVATRFLVDSTYTICKVELFLRKVGSPTHTVYVEIRTNDGDNPGSVITNGTSNGVDVSGIGASEEWVTFDGLAGSLSTGTYWMTVEATASPNDWTNYIQWSDVSGSCTVGSNHCLQSSADTVSWADYNNVQTQFKAYK